MAACISVRMSVSSVVNAAVHLVASCIACPALCFPVTLLSCFALGSLPLVLPFRLSEEGPILALNTEAVGNICCVLQMHSLGIEVPLQ